MRVCSLDGCDRPSGVPGTTKKLCAAHYNRKRRHGSFDKPARPEPVRLKVCEFPDCDKPQRGRGYCATHWKRLKKHGDVNIVKRAPNWTGEEDAKLLDLPTYPRSGCVKSGYLQDLALYLGRSDNAARSRLHRIRRIAAQKRLNRNQRQFKIEGQSQDTVF